MSSQPTSEEATNAEGSSMHVFGLLQIVTNLINIGLNSVERWLAVVEKMKTNPKIKSHPELLHLQTLLVQIAQHFSSKLFDFFPCDLSQDKIPLMLAKEIPTKTLLKAVRPLLKKKNFIDKTFSAEAYFNLKSVVEQLLHEVLTAPINLEPDQPENETEDKTMKRKRVDRSKEIVKKPRVSQSPCFSDSSSNSGESSCESADSDSDLSDGDTFEKLFKGNTMKKGPVKIKQIFQTQKKRLRRKLTSPGEEGGYMIKIEITDTKDLRNCMVKDYWTKVSTKAVFLTDPKSSTYKQIKSLLYDVGRRIKSISGTEAEETKLDKKSK